MEVETNTRSGRPSYQPTQESRDVVVASVAAGLPHDAVAMALGIAPKTLRKHFRDELDLGKGVANARVAGKLFESCMNGNVSALIFWAKTQLGWRETSRVELSEVDPATMTDAQLVALLRETEDDDDGTVH